MLRLEKMKTEVDKWYPSMLNDTSEVRCYTFPEVRRQTADDARPCLDYSEIRTKL